MKIIPAVGAPSHSSMAPGSLTVEEGLTVISNTAGTPGHPLVKGVTVTTPV